MTVRILLITHEDIGTALLKAANHTYGGIPIPTTVVAVNYKMNPDCLLPQLTAMAKKLPAAEGLLILTDLYGSTPCNIALALEAYTNVRVVSGLNLPMLLKVMNYPQLDLSHLTEKALHGGKEGVVDCSCEHHNISTG